MKALVKIGDAVTLKGVLKRVNYGWQGVMFADEKKEWADLLRTPILANIASQRPHFHKKLLHPYLTKAWRTPEKLEALKQHYNFVKAQFPKAMSDAVCGISGIRLAEIVGENVKHLELRLQYARNDREGELSLVLFHAESNIEMVTLSFTIIRYYRNSRVMFVGGLQGHKSVSRRQVVALTRKLHGLRPKALLLFALQQLVALWGITSLRAVSDAKHVARHFLTQRAILASYDKFWIERGGIMAADGIFDLPVKTAPREMSAIKPNKRKMYRQRYALLTVVSHQLKSNTLLFNSK